MRTVLLWVGLLAVAGGVTWGIPAPYASDVKPAVKPNTFNAPSTAGGRTQ